MRVCRYKTAQFKGYFLGARAILDILFKFAPGVESGRKIEGFILDFLMQFKQMVKIAQQPFNVQKLLNLWLKKIVVLLYIPDNLFAGMLMETDEDFINRTVCVFFYFVTCNFYCKNAQIIVFYL